MSMPDLFLILPLAIISTALFMKRDVRLRWSLAILGCAVLAALLTPADLYSTLIVALGLVVAYYFGTQHSARRAPLFDVS